MKSKITEQFKLYIVEKRIDIAWLNREDDLLMWCENLKIKHNSPPPLVVVVHLIAKHYQHVAFKYTKSLLAPAQGSSKITHSQQFY